MVLLPGDKFYQQHHLSLPEDALPGTYYIELGLYDPKTGHRWPLAERDETVGYQYDLDRLLIPVEVVP